MAVKIWWSTNNENEYKVRSGSTVRGLAIEISRFRNSAFSQRLISIFDRNYSGKASPRQRLIYIC